MIHILGFDSNFFNYWVDPNSGRNYNGQALNKIYFFEKLGGIDTLFLKS